MKKILALILVFAILVSGCGVQQESTVAEDNISVDAVVAIEDEEIEVADEAEAEAEESAAVEASTLEFSGLDDEALLEYLEQTLYSNLIDELETEECFIEDVETVYISKEYLEETAYNSQSNIYFGYTLEEIEETYGSGQFIFTLGEDGTTTVQAFEGYDDTYDQIVRNVAIGTGVILICVTISIVTGGTAPTVVSMIFATSAKTSLIMALQSAGLSAVIGGVLTGVTTGSFDEAVKAAALSASEGFMWGAIGGAVLGGVQEAYALSKLTANGLTLSQAAQIQRSTKYSAEMISQLRSVEEATYYYETLGLVEETIDGEVALIRTIDLTYVSELGGQQVTNLERMSMGYAAIDPITGEAYELHHISQTVDSSLAILSSTEHTGSGVYSLIHDTSITEGVHSLITTSEWASQRSSFWKAMAEYCAAL